MRCVKGSGQRIEFPRGSLSGWCVFADWVSSIVALFARRLLVSIAFISRLLGWAGQSVFPIADCRSLIARIILSGVMSGEFAAEEFGKKLECLKQVLRASEFTCWQSIHGFLEHMKAYASTCGLHLKPELSMACRQACTALLDFVPFGDDLAVEVHGLRHLLLAKATLKEELQKPVDAFQAWCKTLESTEKLK